jgi:hypothetical protein
MKMKPFFYFSCAIEPGQPLVSNEKKRNKALEAHTKHRRQNQNMCTICGLSPKGIPQNVHITANEFVPNSSKLGGYHFLPVV